MSEDAMHWTTALERHPAFTEFMLLTEGHLEKRRRMIETLLPGASSDQFQRIAGQIEALRWVIALPNSQKPKPGEKK